MKALLLILIFASFKTTKVQAQAVDIGDVTELKGQAQIVRDDAYQASLDFVVQQNDLVETNVGRIGITFLDDSVVRLTEHSKLTIDEYVFDPNPSNSKLALNFASGTARFITGKLGAINKENISIQTPTANIAI
ncbi:MAG: FecR domain-containing protein, partial [Methylophilaceae bacterium]